MKLYDDKRAPNPRRVRMYLAEKGIDVPLVPVSVAERENRKEEFKQKNTLRQRSKLPHGLKLKICLDVNVTQTDLKNLNGKELLQLV